MTPEQRIPPPAGNASYIWAVVVIVLAGLAFLLGVMYLRPQTDPLVLIGGILGALAPTTAAVLSFMKAQQTHLSVNGRLDAFITARGRAAHAEGVLEGIAQQTAQQTAQPAGATGPAPSNHPA